MNEQENRTQPFVGDADVKPAVPAFVTRILMISAILTDICILAVCLLFFQTVMIASAFCAIFGQIFIRGYINMRAEFACYTKYTVGQVVDIICKPRSGKFPIIAYTVNGVSYSIEGNVGRPDYKLGQEAWVYFNPDNPRKATQKLPAEGLVFSLAGGMIWGLGVLLLITHFVNVMAI